MGKNRKSAGGGNGGAQPETPTDEGNNGGQELFTDEQWAEAKTPEELAELTGWQFSVTSNGSYEFYDAENDLILHIDKQMLSRKYIDKTSSGIQAPDNKTNLRYGVRSQDLRDIVRMVHELPKANKQAAPAIVFKNKLATNTLGQHGYVSRNFSGEIIDHVVVINSSSFRKLDGHSIRRTLLHETNHALDFMAGKGTHRNYSDTHGISTKSSFRDAVDKDGRVSQNASKYYMSNPSTFYKECWADAASIVQMKQLGYGNERVLLPSGYGVTVDDWIDKYPNVYKATQNELKAAPDSSSFNKPEKFQSVGTYISNEFGLRG